jgi:carboxypeptidase D
MNPDGFEYEYKQTKHAQGQGRLNANKIDLNRNFPKVELEHIKTSNENDIVIPKQGLDNTEHRLDKLTIYPFVLSGNLHGGALVANYPFDNRLPDSIKKESKSPDDQTFQMLAKAYSHVN